MFQIVSFRGGSKIFSRGEAKILSNFFKSTKLSHRARAPRTLAERILTKSLAPQANF